MDQVSRYIDELTGAGDHLSEVHMCTRFTARILGGLLDYEDDAWVINPHAGEDETGEGIPDVSIYAKHGEECFPWIVCEAKLEDREIRDESRRAALWADKRKYVTADTVFFMWLARRTILICNPLGQVLTGVYLQEEETDAPKEIICTTSDRDVREHLSLIAAEQAESLTFLEDFREGELPFGYLDVNRETIARLTGTLRSVLGALRAYLRRRWALMSREYAHYRKKRTALEEALDQGGDAVPRHVQELRRERLDHEHRQCVQLFEYAFPQFCEQQSYTRWSPEENDLSEREALRDIFTTDAAYVIIGRLLFVRFAEDQRDDSGEPLMARKISNGGLQLWRQLIGSGEPFIGKLIDLAFTQAGSVFRQVFSETPFDTLIDLDDREFDRVLLLVLYKLNAFDFRGIDRDLLGDLYQKLLPRDMRKKLGEFYTDDEVVEYILHRTGFVAAAREGAPTILDPACGSGTFLVRAAHYLIEGARARGIDDREILELVGRCINGLDINDFAVFIARINLLFTCFDLVLNAQRDIAFSVHEANSLLQPGQTSMFVTDDGSSLDLGLTRAEQVRDGDYDFVVGNPPYVRIHRLPESEREGLRQLYDNVAHGMIDIATFFVARTRGWLRPDGIAGMIVPRAITDAEHTSQLRAQFSAGRLRLRDVTPLDWVSRQLFDSDVVPAIILWDVDETTPEEVSVRGPVRDVGELVSREGPATRSLPYSTFVGDGDTPWPLAATDRDYDVAQHLDGFGNLVDWVETGFGMMTGPNAHVHDGPATDRTPLLGGADVYSFWRGWPRRWVDVADVANPTLWRGATWDAEARLFTGGNLPTVAVACPVISITVNAAPFDPRSCCLQDTCTYSFASDHSEAGTYALLGLLNSQLLRYYTFVFLRSGVVGGGRRDSHIYKRTIAACPSPGSRDLTEISNIARRCAALALPASRLEQELWADVVSTEDDITSLSAWPIRWHDWPDRYGLSTQTQLMDRLDAQTLQLSRGITVTSDEPSVLDFLECHLPMVVERASRISKSEAQSLPVPSVVSVPSLLEQYDTVIEERDRAREDYLRLVNEVDEAVFEVFAMPAHLRRVVRERMSEFPLNEYAARPRKPWEPTRPPQIQLFEPGERYS